MANLDKLVELVETTIDLQELDNHKYVIKADFDEGLQQIAVKLEKAKEGLNNQFKGAADDLGFELDAKKNPLNFENHQVYGHCFRLTRKVSLSSSFSAKRVFHIDGLDVFAS